MPTKPNALRVPCRRCLAPVGSPCRRLIGGGFHVSRRIDGKTLVREKKNAARRVISVSAEKREAIRAAAKERGMSSGGWLDAEINRALDRAGAP